jgi:hypothetical protein
MKGLSISIQSCQEIKKANVELGTMREAANGKITAQSQPRQKVITINKLSIVVRACNPSYSGGIGRSYSQSENSSGQKKRLGMWLK